MLGNVRDAQHQFVLDLLQQIESLGAQHLLGRFLVQFLIVSGIDLELVGRIHQLKHDFRVNWISKQLHAPLTFKQRIGAHFQSQIKQTH